MASTNCQLIAPNSSMQQCIETYGIEGEGEFVNNSVSREAQFWSCGRIDKRGTLLGHEHDADELALCRKLATTAAKLMGPCWSTFRSGSDPDTHPFFMTAERTAKVPKKISEALIRASFGGTLHPDATITIEPFKVDTKWWADVEEDAGGDETEFGLKPWRDLMKWFPANDLSASAMVRVEDSKDVSYTLGCVYPNLVIGISAKGSLIGIMTHVVS